MFFPSKIRSITKSDLVLEIGPGADPFKRSDILLEKKFENENEAKSQRADKDKIRTKKQIVFFDGKRIPFKDKSFNYIICSHVLEHVDDVSQFVEEIIRIGSRGYFEFPTIYYDYLYNFKVHKSFLLYRDNVLNWMPKKSTCLDSFYEVQKLFYEANLAGKKSVIKELKKYLFQGFEWNEKIVVKKQSEIFEVTFMDHEIILGKSLVQILKNIKNKYLRS